MKPQKLKAALSKWNQASESLKKQPFLQSDGTVDLAKLRKYQNEPSVVASIALTHLFFQAQGLPPPRSYNPSPAYEPVVGGDSVAIQAYASLVREHVKNLNSLFAKHREFLLPISRNSFNWPMLISNRKPFGDDHDELLWKFQVGKDTIANDPNARFDPTKKFGKVAWELIERIEHCRVTPQRMLELEQMLSNTRCSWAAAARTLPSFKRKPSPEEKKQWLAVVKQVLENDFRDPELASDYRLLVTAPSHKKRWKAVFSDKVLRQFDYLWDSAPPVTIDRISQGHTPV
jgi:hypothetical protein